MAFSRLLKDLRAIARMPFVRISLGEGKAAEETFAVFMARHFRYRIIRRKTMGACLLDLAKYENWESYLDSVSGKNSPAYYRRKALKLGYRFLSINRNDYIDDIFEINTSKDERQGKPMSAEYRTKVERFEDDPSWSYFGILSAEGKLRAYLCIRHVGELSYVGPVLGHGSYLNDGLMNFIFLEATRELFKRGTRYFMYDMYFGAPEGLRKFKEKLTFIPHRVVYRRRKKATLVTDRVLRMCDVALTLAVLIALLPLLGVVALITRLGMGSPVIFTQERIGLGGQTIRIRKFRTMKDASTSDGTPLSDAQRLTSLGRWLRAWSLDELPQLLDVLSGKLSLVGPRPLLVRYLARYNAEQARRHEVRPGITGWTQINGRNALDWATKFRLDTWYVDHRSLSLYFKILLRTPVSVLKRKGISSQNEATMPEFFGNEVKV